MKKEEKIKFVKKSFSIPIPTYEKLLKLAKKQNRNASNMVSKLIEDK